MFYWQFQRYFYMKMMETIIAADLATNLLLYFLCTLQAKNKNQVFSKLFVW